MNFFFLIFFKFFSKKIEKNLHANRRNLQRKREKNRLKIAILSFGSVIGGAECHFAEFLFFAVKQATIPDYKL